MVGMASLSVIVPMPWLFAIVAFVGVVRVTKNVSVSSLMLSSVVETLNVVDVDPAAIVAVPLVAV